MTREPYIYIHWLSSVESPCEAAGIGENIVDILREFGVATVPEIKRYWKIPEYYECSAELRAPSLSEVLLLSVMEKLGHGWQNVSSTCFVWNHSGGNQFADARVKWAEIELINV